MSHIDCEAKVLQEVSAEDWLLHICDYERPAKGATEAQAQGERACTVRSNLAAVSCN